MPLWYDSKAFSFSQGFPEKNFESKRGGFHKTEDAQHVFLILIAEHWSHRCICNTTSNSDGVGVCETRDGKDGINTSCPADNHCVIELGATAVLYSQTLTKELAGHDNKPCSPFL